MNLTNDLSFVHGDYMFVDRDGRESHIVTKKFEVKQIESDVNTQNDDGIDFSQTVSLSEVR